MNKTVPGQMTLDYFSVPPAPMATRGGLDVAQAVRERLAEVLHDAARQGLDRYEVAARVSRLAGRDVTKNMLDRYTCEAGDWRFPLEALPALCQATGDLRLLELVAEACGCRLLRGEEALLAEIGALTLQERAAHERLAHLRGHVPGSVMERLVGEVLKRMEGRK